MYGFFRLESRSSEDNVDSRREDRCCASYSIVDSSPSYSESQHVTDIQNLNYPKLKTENNDKVIRKVKCDKLGCNPGQDSRNKNILKCMYFNARSIVNKLEELELCIKKKIWILLL